ncbi:MAG TPA: VOC family protein [Thermomicrobiales bacterium]|nr:VOC family protein [Thermomicrobiales bacterium]
MARSIDHIVIAVRDLARASADFARAGFTVTPGGEHASGDTHNALITFGDGSYFELIAFKEPDRPQEHRWWPRLQKGEGYVDFALASDDLEAEAAQLRQRGLEVEGPIDGGRTRPDGERLEWRTIQLSDAAGLPLPFVIQDVTDRALRVPGGTATEHPLGVTHVDGVTVAVGNLVQSADDFAAITGTNGKSSASSIAGVRAAQRFPIGKQWIELVEPDASQSDLRQYLERRGTGPYEVVLGGAGASAEIGKLLPLDATHGARIRIGH